MPHLLYIGQTPAEGTGSPVIVLRHLERLSDAGWTISLVVEPGQDTSACVKANWTVATLPLRRKWWPPLRRSLGFTRSIRSWLLARECERLFSRTPPDAVLGYLAAHDDFLSEVATRYAARCHAPLSLLIHDDAAAFAHDQSDKVRLHRRHRWMLGHAHRRWFVSPELAIAYGVEPTCECLLPPISSAKPEPAQWQPTFSGTPHVYYAGFIWPAQFPLLRKIATILHEAGAKLVLLTQSSPALLEFLRGCPVAHVAPFPTNREALRHLAREAAGVIVSYSDQVSDMPWIATSFPSKLVEYTHLGLPCAIVAPADSAVGRWARSDLYRNFFRPEDAESLGAWARDLRKESTWKKRSEPSRLLATGQFSPERIQATFMQGLLRH